MLTQAVTPELITQWKALFQKYRPLLRPNRKPASLLASFLMECYPLSVCTDHCWEEAIRGNVLENPSEREKLPPGAFPLPVAFRVKNSGTGASLYQSQEEGNTGSPIYVGMDLITGYFQVEGGCRLLWDQLFAFRGLDAMDLENYYLVAEYIGCLRRFGKLERTLGELNQP